LRWLETPLKSVLVAVVMYADDVVAASSTARSPILSDGRQRRRRSRYAFANK